ncbi:hypothetical protein TRIUR3_20826 [Triticum urartu]|uniref:Uncharacterized protein n=2 Tax=Triticum urartu TaxID=4572 RepID=M7YN95_TRIUA|nr:uncharacterized protein LOC125554959 [Triticum urartu]EMS52008.1 hypothetical protein TRIUR3_20826 [Triticum urartu]
MKRKNKDQRRADGITDRGSDSLETMRPNKKQRLGGSSGSNEEREPSPYLVVGHGSVSPAFSVFKVEPYTDGGGGDTPVSIPRRLARLKCKHNMCFVPLTLKDRRWIVGVGGSSTKNYYGPGTIVFDTEKQLVIRGPEPKSIKSLPILLPIDQKIYSLSRSPSVKGPLDYLPWFEVLDLSQAQAVDGRLTNCKWRSLQRPPFFPWELTPRQYCCPPRVAVESYVAVGSHILVSVTGRVGTYAFDTKGSKKWVTVDDQNDLPFSDGAIPHGRGLFLGLSSTTKAITGYKIIMGTSSLSVVEIPVVSDLEDEEPVARSHNFVSLGIDSGFCLVTCWSVDETPYPPHRRAHIRVRTYKTDDFVESEGKCLVVSKQWMQVYKICDLIRTLDEPCLVGVVYI